MDIRPVTDDEIPAFRAAMMQTFGGDPASDPTGEERLRKLVAPGRLFGAFDRGLLVGTAGTYDFTLTVPGAELPMAGLTMVAVRPTHRRRGLLRGLIAAHLDEARGRGLPTSALWATEASIYGRFGYGIAAEADDVSFTAADVGLADGAGDDIEPVVEDAPAALPPLYDRVRAERPGMISRSPEWWTYRRFSERPIPGRPASSPRRHAIARRDGVDTGYVVYRHRGGWEDNVPAGTVDVEELIATDARAETSLWRFICNLDLFPKVTYWNAPSDWILPWIVADSRRLRRRRVETLWVRLDDLPLALAARAYPADGALALEIVDPPAPAGVRLELAVEGGRGRCAPAERPADLRLSRQDLATLYFGAARPTVLARAGRIAGDAHSLALADRLFATPVAAWCAEVF